MAVTTTDRKLFLGARLKRLRRDLGLTFVIVSHDLAVIAHMCDRLAVMRDARIVETLDRRQLQEGRLTADYSRELLAASGVA